MPNIASVGWVNIKGATVPQTNHNASTIASDTTIPTGHYSLLYGPLTIGSDIEFKIEADAQVKIKAFADV